MKENTIRELLEPVEVAILLGAEIPALVGTYGYVLSECYGWHVDQHDVESYEKVEIIGIFPSQEEAEVCFAERNIAAWQMPSRGPWLDDPILKDLPTLAAQKEGYLKKHSYRDFLAWWNNNVLNPYQITKLLVGTSGNLFQGNG